MVKKPLKNADQPTPSAGSTPVDFPVVSTNPDKSAPQKSGPKSSYNPDLHPQMAFALTGKLGADITRVAMVLDVSRDTIYRWMAQHPEFQDAIKRGRELYDSISVEGALLKSALGFPYTERTYERQEVLVKKGEGDEPDETEFQEVLVKRVEKHMAPNVASIIMWLQNRMPERWKNMKYTKNESTQTLLGLVGHVQPGDLMVDFSKMDRKDVEQLRAIIQRSNQSRSGTSG